ncbi:MAG: hypothetical protein ACK4TL_18540 [Hyphomicrobiaceae bacterium]
MHVPDVMSLSLGEWGAIATYWERVHRKGAVALPPTEAEFDAAVQRLH